MAAAWYASAGSWYLIPSKFVCPGGKISGATFSAKVSMFSRSTAVTAVDYPIAPCQVTTFLYPAIGTRVEDLKVYSRHGVDCSKHSYNQRSK